MEKAIRLSVATLLVLFLVSCGIFNKQKRSSEQKYYVKTDDKIEVNKGVSLQNKEVTTDFVELIIRMPKREVKNLKLDSLLAKEEDLHGDLLSMIKDSQETIIRSRHTEERYNSDTDTTEILKSLKSSENGLKRESELNKESDTTIARNIPFYVWVIGGIVVIIAFWMFLRWLKPSL